MLKKPSLFALLALTLTQAVSAAECDLKQPPQTVYGSSPITTYFLISLAPDKVAGLNFPQDKSGKSMLPARLFELPVIGGWFGQGQTPNKETLLSVKPELTLMSVSRHTASVQKQQAMLADLNLPVCTFPLDKLDDYPAAYRTVGQWLGVPDRGNLLANYAQNTLESLAKARASITKPVSVYYAQGNDGLSTECRGSAHAEVIELAGAVNPHVCESQSGFGMVKVNLEQVLAENPDYIVTQDKATLAHILNDRRWQSVPAVKAGKVLLMPGDPWRWMDRPPSFTRLIGAPWLMHQLYPELVTQAQLSASTREFFSLFFNHSLDEASLARLLSRQGGAS